MIYNNNILELESTAEELLSKIKDIKKMSLETNRLEDDYYTIESFYKHFYALEMFVKSMRMQGYFGKSPHKKEDLEKQDLIFEHLFEIKKLVENVHKLQQL